MEVINIENMDQLSYTELVKTIELNKERKDFKIINDLFEVTITFEEGFILISTKKDGLIIGETKSTGNHLNVQEDILRTGLYKSLQMEKLNNIIQEKGVVIVDEFGSRKEISIKEDIIFTTGYLINVGQMICTGEFYYEIQQIDSEGHRGTFFNTTIISNNCTRLNDLINLIK